MCRTIDLRIKLLNGISYISSIKDYDTDLNKKLNYLDVSKNIKNKDKNKIKILGVKLYRSKNWNDTLEKVKKYIDKNNKRLYSTNNNKDILKLGRWIMH
jgi:hypothetical protein